MLAAPPGADFFFDEALFFLFTRIGDERLRPLLGPKHDEWLARRS